MRESPPISGLAGASLMYCGGEHIPNTRNVFAGRLDLKQRIELIWVGRRKLLDGGDAKYREIGTRGWANVAQSLKWIGDAGLTPRRPGAHDVTALHISTRNPLLSRT